MIDYEAIRQLIPPEGTSIEDLSDKIYAYYSDSKPEPSQEAYSHTVGGYYKDRGWFYDKRLNRYFKSIGKYLLKKGSEAVVAGHEEFSIDPLQKSIGQKNLVNILIPKKIETPYWIWLNGKHYHGFSYQARLYFSLKKDSVKSIRFIQALTKILNDKEIPFRLKYEKKFTQRNENSVLYFDKAHYFLVFIIVKNYRALYAEAFRQPVCFPFVKTFPEFPGVAFAEDPDSGQSFGQQRSRVLAEILMDKGKETVVIDRELRARGFNPEKFYLNPDTGFPYNFRVFETGGTYQDYTVDFPKGKEYTYLPMVKKIVYLILKNFVIYYDDSGEDIFHIPECKNKPGNTWDTAMDKTMYKLCSESEKAEILHFLVNYLRVLQQMSLNDPYVHEFAGYYFQSFKTVPGGFEEGLETLSTAHSDHPVAHIRFLEMKDISPEKHREYLQSLIRNFKHRGVVSYLPNDEFIVSYSNFGYAYIGTHLLQMISTR